MSWVAVLLSTACLAQAATAPSFYKDVLPVLQQRCQECHRPTGIAPVSFITYNETRPWAKAIRANVLNQKMPPWFADPCCGKFANDRSLTAAERDTLVRWAGSGAPKGSINDAPAPRAWPDGWSIVPDTVLAAPTFELPAKGELDYQYFVVPTGFTEDRWVQASEVRSSNRRVVHHAVVYIREPGDTSFPARLPDGAPAATTADILNVYAPGASPQILPPGMGKLVKAGSDLVFEIHYTPSGKRVTDHTRIALQLSGKPPQKRVLTLQLNNSSFVIPAGARDFRVRAWGTLPNDALLLGFFPHMHLRGKEFQYTVSANDSPPQTLLLVRPYDFYWQLYYRLAAPMMLKAGTRLESTATYDNSANNPRNPDPGVDVRYGLQSRQEMMVGFFDVAVDANVDKKAFFIRSQAR